MSGNEKYAGSGNRIRIPLLLLFIVLLGSLQSQDSLGPSKESKLHVKGFIKDMQGASFVDDAQSLVTSNYIHNRINFRYDAFSSLFFRIELRNRLFYGEQVKLTPGFGDLIDQDNGYFDLSYNLVNDTSVVLNTMIDRALVNWSRNKLDVTLGRQRINWGINFVWNPNDIFNTFNYFDFDYEERPGSDAIRLQYNTSAFSSFQAAYKPSKKIKEQVAAILYKTNYREFDLQTLAGVFMQDVVVGAGWSGNFKRTGIIGEASYFHPYEKWTDTSGSLVASLSFDRTFSGEVFLMGSYLYNGNGGEIPYGAADYTRGYLTVKNMMPYKHTFFLQITKMLNPLVNVGFATMYSPTKHTIILLPTVNVSVSDNWELSFFAQSFQGEVNHVYRTIGNVIYMRLRWSF